MTTTITNLSGTTAGPDALEHPLVLDRLRGDTRPEHRRHEAGRRLRWLLRTGPVGSLVEAGSVDGVFLAAARRAGITATAIEISEDGVRPGPHGTGLPGQSGGDGLPTSDRPVQAVCAFHVLHRVPDPVALVETAWELLEPGGRLAVEVEVPDGATAAGHLDRIGTEAPPQRRWPSSPVALRRLVERCGFEVLVQDTRTSSRPSRFRLDAVRQLVMTELRGSVPVRRPGDVLRIIARKPPEPTHDELRWPA